MVVIDPPKQSLDLLREALSLKGSSTEPSPEESENIEVLAYVASLASTLAKTQDFGSETWVEALGPYMANLDETKFEEPKEIIEKFRILSEKAVVDEEEEEDDDDDETGGEELCNIRFSLAYGGKILLHQTKLKLRRGHRYALVGQNGAGKTTLMTAINVSFFWFFEIVGFMDVKHVKLNHLIFVLRLVELIRMANLKVGHSIFVLNTLIVEVTSIQSMKLKSYSNT